MIKIGETSSLPGDSVSESLLCLQQAQTLTQPDLPSLRLQQL